MKWSDISGQYHNILSLNANYFQWTWHWANTEVLKLMHHLVSVGYSFIIFFIGKKDSGSQAFNKLFCLEAWLHWEWMKCGLGRSAPSLCFACLHDCLHDTYAGIGRPLLKGRNLVTNCQLVNWEWSTLQTRTLPH